MTATIYIKNTFRKLYRSTGNCRLRPMAVRVSTLIALAAALCACGKEETVPHLGWPKVSAEVDSLTYAVEKCILNYENADSAEILLKKLTDASAGFPPELNLEKRINLFEAGIHSLRFETAEAHSIVAQLKNTVDSAADPYLYNRIMSREMYVDSLSGFESQRNLLNQIQYFESTGDSVSTAISLIYLSNRYLKMREAQSALDASLRADSILADIRYDETRFKNKVNLMVIHDMAGDTASRNRIARELVKNNLYKDNLKFSTALSVNAYNYLGEPAYLYDAYNRIRGMASMSSLTAIVEAALAEMHFAGNRPDSTAAYARAALGKLSFVKDISHKAEIYKVMSQSCEREGKMEEALAYHKKMKECEDSFLAESNPVDFIKMRYNMDMDNSRRMARQQSRETHFKWTIWVLAIGLAVAVLIIHLLTRSVSLREQIRLARMERDKSYRKAAVTMLSVAEKERHLKDMENRIVSCRDEGKISGQNAQQLISALKVNMADSTDWNNFAEYFAGLHPHFEDKLRAAYPSLTIKQVQLCCYIKMGLDSQRIAQIMNVKPESIWQMKWRIRQKMKLESEDKLSVLIAGIE